MNYISLNREELKKLTQDLKIFSDNITGKYIEFTEDYENNINYVYDYYKNYVHNIVTDNFEDLKGIEIDDSLYEIKEGLYNFQMINTNLKYTLYKSLVLYNPYPTSTYFICNLSNTKYSLNDLIIKKKRLIFNKKYLKIPNDSFIIIFDWDYSGMYIFSNTDLDINNLLP